MQNTNFISLDGLQTFKDEYLDTNFALDVDVVKTNIAQELTESQKITALNNIEGKTFIQNQHTGLGKIYLQKNNGVLTQEMLNKDNTIYVVRHDSVIYDGILRFQDFEFTSSQVSTIKTEEKIALDEAQQAYNNDPTDENLTILNNAQQAYENINSQDYYYWQSFVLPKHQAIYLTGRAIRINANKDNKIDTNSGAIYAPSDEDLTIYIGCLYGEYSYKNGDYITLPQNSILEFDGGNINSGIVVLNNNTSIINGSFTKVMIDAENCNDITIKDTSLDGNSEITTNLLYFNNVKNINITNLEIKNFRQNGAGSGENIHCSSIKNCENINILGLKLKNIYPEAPLFENCKNLYFTNIYFDSYSDNPSDKQVFTLLHCFFCDNVVIRDSYFRKSRVDGSTINFTCKNSLIDGCVFDGGQGIDLSNEVNDIFSSENVTIKNCKVINSHFGIYTYPSNENVKNIIITNCLFDVEYLMRLHNTFGVYVDNCSIKCQVGIHPTKSAEGYDGPYTKLMGNYVFTNNNISCCRLVSIQSGLLVSENWYGYIQQHPNEKSWWTDGSVWVKFDDGIIFKNNNLNIDSSLYPDNENHPVGDAQHFSSALVACQSMSYVPYISFEGCKFEGDIENIILSSGQNINVHRLDFVENILAFDDYENIVQGHVVKFPLLDIVNISKNVFRYCCLWVRSNMKIDNNVFVVNTNLPNNGKQYPLRFEYGNDNTVITNNDFGNGYLYFYSLNLNKGVVFVFDNNINYNIYYSQTQDLTGLKSLLSLHQKDVSLSCGGNTDKIPDANSYDIPIGTVYYDIQNRPLFFNGTKWTEADGSLVGVKHSGTMSERPTGDKIKVGFQYMQIDDTNGTYPLWASSINGTNVTWIKYDGTIA